MHITDYVSPICVHTVIVLPKLGFPASAQGLLPHTKKKQNPTAEQVPLIMANSMSRVLPYKCVTSQKWAQNTTCTSEADLFGYFGPNIASCSTVRCVSHKSPWKWRLGDFTTWEYQNMCIIQYDFWPFMPQMTFLAKCCPKRHIWKQIWLLIAWEVRLFSP